MDVSDTTNSGLLREPRETAGITSRLMLAYAERVGGTEAVGALLRRAGLAEHEAELRDENTWFSFDTKVRLFEALAEVLDDPAATRKAGALALELNVGDGVKVALRALGSPGIVYRNIVRANAKFSTRHLMELLDLGAGRARIRFVDVTGGDVHPLDCQYNIGLLSCVPSIFGLAPARVTHPSCAVHGADGCVYDITWERGAVTARSVLASVVASGAALTAAALAAPAALPVAGLGAAGAAGWLVARVARARRARWRALEADLAEQAAVSRRLSASLHDLVSELRFEELLDKVVGNARAAVNGKEFALLVAEDGGLLCRSSTGLPAAAVATLEGWAAKADALSGGEPVLVEDVAVVDALAPLGKDPDRALRSLCAAPLVFRGERVGVLVALAGHARTFLPRDVDLVRDYAVQAAIALANARLFSVQHALATRDPLTSLLNHREFHEVLARELERSRRYGAPLTVALFDLNGFKLVNDASGHAEGDRVLRETAAALEDACRESDLAFRLGGDEFALLLPETEGGAAEAVARRAADAVGEVDERTSAAYGIASWPADGGSKDVLLAQADARLYAMKGADRMTFVAPAGETGRRADQRERLALAGRLSQRLATLTEAERIAQAAVAELQGTFDYFLAYVQRLDGATLRCIAGGGAAAEHMPIVGWAQGVDEGVNGRVIRTGRPALVHDSALDTDHIGPSEVVLRSQLAVPLTVGGRAWGVLALESPEAGVFSADDVLLLETIAAQVGAALQRGAQLRELNETVAVLRATLARTPHP